MISQFQNSALPTITSRVGFPELTTTLSFAMLYKPSWQVSALMSIPLFIFLIAIIKQLSANFSSAKTKEREGLILFLTILLSPIAFLALISLLRPYFLERYLVHYIIFGYALIGITLDSAWRHGRHLGSIVLVTSSLLLVTTGIFNLNKTGNFNFQSLSIPSAKQISQNVNCTGSTVVADEPYAYIDAAYYYDGCDLRFYNQDELGPYGGYVPLRFSPNRVSSTEDLNSFTIYHLHLSSDPKLKLSEDSRYQLVKTAKINNYYVDQYQLKSELI